MSTAHLFNHNVKAMANGSRVLAEYTIGSNGYVLCVWRDEYVTWTVGYDAANSNWQAYHGHYFGGNFESAMRDFKVRAGLKQARVTV